MWAPKNRNQQDAICLIPALAPVISTTRVHPNLLGPCLRLGSSIQPPGASTRSLVETRRGNVPCRLRITCCGSYFSVRPHNIVSFFFEFQSDGSVISSALKLKILDSRTHDEGVKLFDGTRRPYTILNRSTTSDQGRASKISLASTTSLI